MKDLSQIKKDERIWVYTYYNLVFKEEEAISIEDCYRIGNYIDWKAVMNDGNVEYIPYHEQQLCDRTLWLSKPNRELAKELIKQNILKRINSMENKLNKLKRNSMINKEFGKPDNYKGSICRYERYLYQALILKYVLEKDEPV